MKRITEALSLTVGALRQLISIFIMGFIWTGRTEKSRQIDEKSERKSFPIKQMADTDLETSKGVIRRQNDEEFE